MLRLRHPTSTAKQRAFWVSPAQYRLFVGGVGSGKTRAGCVEVLRMPGFSVGVVAAPTYAMLRDATLYTFLELATRGGVLRNFNKTDMTADLIDGKHILFRSADEPDRLRGPNLGWFFLDEAAMMDESVWLIMIGRLRGAPGRAWVTTTPRGFNWLHETFIHGGSEYDVIQSSTGENQYLPISFVKSLENSYTGDWRRQELDGEFIDSGSTIFKREWFKIVERAPDNLRWARCWDLAASTKTTADFSASAAVALHDGTLYVRDMIRHRLEWPDIRRIILQTMIAEPQTIFGVEDGLHGLAAVQELQRERAVAHITLRRVKVDRDKISRALPWAARAEAGKVLLVRGAWINGMLDEVSAFPRGAHDDQVDSISAGLALLSELAQTIRGIGAFALGRFKLRDPWSDLRLS